MKTTPIGPFLGINHYLPDFSLSTENGDWLRDAENVDLDNSGWPSRRAALLQIQAMTDAHSLYMLTPTDGYLVRGTAMYAVTLAPSYSETLFRVLTSGAAVSWQEYDGKLYYASATDSGKIISGVRYPMGLPTPAAPNCTTIPGALYDGAYQIGVSYSNSVTGEEGGISASSNPLLPAAGGIRITLPGAATGATHVNVYFSTTNGSIPMWIGSYAVGTAAVDVVAEPTRLREGIFKDEEPLPNGTRLFLFNGQLCSVSGKNLYYGIPYKPGYCLKTNKRVPFESDIGIAIGNQSGLYVSAGKTYFMDGRQIGPDMDTRVILHYGAVPGTEFVIESAISEALIIGWFGARGIVFADTSGAITEVMAQTIKQTPPASGVSVVVEENGEEYRKVVSCGWCVNVKTKAASRYSAWPVTSASRGYVTVPTGVCTLSGGAAKIEGHISLGKKNFRGENLKHLPACYIGAVSATPMELRVTTPDHEDYHYEARSCGDDLQIHRIDPGKGLRANWYDLSLYNTEGSYFALTSFSFAPAVSGRRI